jgi:hypothetical protein
LLPHELEEVLKERNHLQNSACPAKKLRTFTSDCDWLRRPVSILITLNFRKTICNARQPSKTTPKRNVDGKKAMLCMVGLKIPRWGVLQPNAAYFFYYYKDFSQPIKKEKKLALSKPQLKIKPSGCFLEREPRLMNLAK